jgi:hypothetical protein
MQRYRQLRTKAGPQVVNTQRALASPRLCHSNPYGCAALLLSTPSSTSYMQMSRYDTRKIAVCRPGKISQSPELRVGVLFPRIVSQDWVAAA